MAKIERYEDLRCWQQARKLVISMYELIRKPDIKIEFELSDHLKRTSISVMTNVAEQFSRYHKKDFIRFLDCALSSAQEVKSLLYMFLIKKWLDAEKVHEIQYHCDHCQALILALLKQIRNSLDENSNRTNESEVYYLTKNRIPE